MTVSLTFTNALSWTLCHRSYPCILLLMSIATHTSVALSSPALYNHGINYTTILELLDAKPKSVWMWHIGNHIDTAIQVLRDLRISKRAGWQEQEVGVENGWLWDRWKYMCVFWGRRLSDEGDENTVQRRMNSRSFRFLACCLGFEMYGLKQVWSVCQVWCEEKLYFPCL